MEKSPSWEANSCSATHSIPCLLQNTSVHYYFHHSLSHTLSHNSFSPPTFCSHTYSSLNNIAITVHMFSALQMQCWHTKIREKRGETLTNHGIPHLTYRSQIGTNNTWWSSNLKPHQIYPKIHILNSNNQTINLVHNDKHNPQAKLPVLNWHNQNRNITTVEMLVLLLQWLYSKLWESEFRYLWQQRTCHCVCSLVYVQVKAPKSRADCSFWLRISDNPVHVSHVTFILH